VIEAIAKREAEEAVVWVLDAQDQINQWLL
jgi:hypothetical protein